MIHKFAMKPDPSLTTSNIVVIQIADLPYDATSNKRWQAFMASVVQLQQSAPDLLQKQKGVARLAENVWLVNFQDNPSALARLVSCAVQHRLTYGILQLDAAPQWLPVGFDPKPI